MRRVRSCLVLTTFAAVAVVALAACVPPAVPPPPSDAPPLPGNCAPRGPYGTSVLCVFVRTGSVQTFAVPAGVHAVTIDAWGAQGQGEPVNVPGIGTVQFGGEGGHARGTFTVAGGTTLAVFVGGRDGWNGGSSGGGGASDVRRGGIALDDRIVVAGGGGARGRLRAFSAGLDVDFPFPGGRGGGPEGAPGICDIPLPGQTLHISGCGGGATASAGGAGGLSGVTGACEDPAAVDGQDGTRGAGGAGGTATCTSPQPADAAAPGGGGGWFGGGGGGAGAQAFLPHVSVGAPSGGGSGYVAPDATGAVNEVGGHLGDGFVAITYSRVPTSRAACRHGGWHNLVDDLGHGFPSKAACVAWVKEHTK
jgi:hypothetical protein